MDFFDFHGKTYLLVLDYHSRWPEIRRLDNLTSSSIISSLKSTLATHGILYLMISDNGPQFASAKFKKFVPNTDSIVHAAPEPQSGESDYIRDLGRSGLVTVWHPNPRPYIIQTE
ncbi:Pol polyprotein [Plakobranchus ocellatus]|uniref:Pol polyprotein n=1 Tax=Plakobranchus ocellatus TaxID=259542 RepID=A0AAV4B2M5_9GAST|nr:Pol polyprotein [Plakobranchus ocellatus]